VFFSRFHGSNSADNHSVFGFRRAAPESSRLSSPHPVCSSNRGLNESRIGLRKGDLPTHTAFDAGCATGIHFGEKMVFFLKTDYASECDLSSEEIPPLHESPWTPDLRDPASECRWAFYGVQRLECLKSMPGGI
jgi:hypothetical protein